MQLRNLSPFPELPFERFSSLGSGHGGSAAIEAALLVNRYSDDVETHFYLTPTRRALASPCVLLLRLSAQQLLCATHPRVARATRVHLILKARVEEVSTFRRSTNAGARGSSYFILKFFGLPWVLPPSTNKQAHSSQVNVSVLLDAPLHTRHTFW